MEANVWLVEYRVYPGGRNARSKKAPIIYRFEVDLARKTLMGRNPAARDLLSGGARPSSRNARPRAGGAR